MKPKLHKNVSATPARKPKKRMPPRLLTVDSTFAARVTVTQGGGRTLLKLARPILFMPPDGRKPLRVRVVAPLGPGLPLGKTFTDRFVITAARPSVAGGPMIVWVWQADAFPG
jgi:hypothetical protein